MSRRSYVSLPLWEVFLILLLLSTLFACISTLSLYWFYSLISTSCNVKLLSLLGSPA